MTTLVYCFQYPTEMHVVSVKVSLAKLCCIFLSRSIHRKLWNTHSRRQLFVFYGEIFSYKRRCVKSPSLLAGWTNVQHERLRRGEKYRLKYKFVLLLLIQVLSAKLQVYICLYSLVDFNIFPIDFTRLQHKDWLNHRNKDVRHTNTMSQGTQQLKPTFLQLGWIYIYPL